MTRNESARVDLWNAAEEVAELLAEFQRAFNHAESLMHTILANNAIDGRDDMRVWLERFSTLSLGHAV
jgi:hypothetical protein